jgi:MFS family permease
MASTKLLVHDSKVNTKNGMTPASEIANEKKTEDAMSLETPAVDEKEYPTGVKLFTIIACVYLAMFLPVLDRTIIATAVPRITDEFHSIGDIGWYASSYLVTSSAFQLFYGRVYSFYSIKWVYLSAIGIFEIGSIVCGAAPNSPAFIIGRAISGLGSAGITGGSTLVMVETIPLHRRPLFNGIFGAVFAISSVVGPILGGALTTRASWRWCFYINIPAGAVSIFIIALLLQLPPPRKVNLKFKQKVAQLDPIGTLFFLPGNACLLLALQWGGSTYAWRDARIIVLLVLAILSFTCFVVVQIWKQEFATVPPRIIKQRSIFAGACFTFCAGGAMLSAAYYLPVWLQVMVLILNLSNSDRPSKVTTPSSLGCV